MYKNIWNEFRATQETLEEKNKNEDNTNDVSDDGDGMDKVQPKALKKKFKDRKDKDIDNDGDVDSSDEYLHNRRKTVSKKVDENDDEKKKKKVIGKEKEGDIEVNPKMEKGKMQAEFFKNAAADYVDRAHGKSLGGVHRHLKNISRKKGVVGKIGKKAADAYGNHLVRKKEKENAKKRADLAKKGVSAGMEYEDKKMNEAKASDYKDVAVMKGKGGTQVKVVKDKQGNHVALFSGKGSTQVPIKKMDKKVLQKALDSFSKNGMIGNTLRSIEEKASIRDRLMSVLGEDAAKNRNPNAAKAEKPEDALKGKGAKDMMDQPKEVNDDQEKGHDDASKAGKVTKPAGARSGGDAVRSGDQSIKGVMAAYQKMKGK